MMSVSRVAVELVAEFHPTGGRFLIKDYPKDREHRQIKLAVASRPQRWDRLAVVERHAGSPCIISTVSSALRLARSQELGLGRRCSLR